MSKPCEQNVPLSPGVLELLEQQKQRFVAKFGREPGPKDPIFFDEETTSPQPVAESGVTTILDSLLDQAKR
jgi:hypothetical protein